MAVHSRDPKPDPRLTSFHPLYDFASIREGELGAGKLQILPNELVGLAPARHGAA
jgi:hypothetical protein